ncbi:hypothetical protein SAMN02799625_04658 [Methylobacterium sp. UNC300MFChir4.1]|uniref:hypothetical protein n=1 Tax=Methylobacterium sp. UNC300MFChir4.1 TaxID=1502747 RepID=UPI0008C70E7F|nr:hypothetical protein [Methylobacterium sp. UNC300MFChir4.1]SEP09621.1 hypothetical protein SAMN02799625_04658 [Methylobacterium sp. UNC300MFChir4.1]
MPFRMSLKKLIRRDPVDGLRERAAELSADLARVSHHLAPEAVVPGPPAAQHIRSPSTASPSIEPSPVFVAIADATRAAAVDALSDARVSLELRRAVEVHRDATIAMLLCPDESNEANDPLCAAVEASGANLRSVPARSLADVRCKLALLLPEILPDVNGSTPTAFLQNIREDIDRLSIAAPDTSYPAPTADSQTELPEAIIQGWAAWGATLGACNDEGEGSDAYNRACERRNDLLETAESLPATMENIQAKALARLWLDWAEDERPGQPRETFRFAGRLAYDVNAAIMGQPVAASPPRPSGSDVISLVGMLDLASASLEDLQALRDVADLVGGVAYATVWTDRCRAHGPAAEHNAAGKLMQWLGEALTDVETAAEKEASRRVPDNRNDRETRLSMLAAGIIDNGDPESIEELACELLAHAKVERGEG